MRKILGALAALLLCQTLTPAEARYAELVDDPQMLRPLMQAYCAQMLQPAQPLPAGETVMQVANRLGIAPEVRVLVAQEEFAEGAFVCGDRILLSPEVTRANQTWLAFVLAHEYAHLVLEDWRELTRFALAQARREGEPVYHIEQLNPLLQRAAAEVAAARHQQELRADAFAVRLMRGAGFDDFTPVLAMFAAQVEASAQHPAFALRRQRIVELLSAPEEAAY